MSHLGKFAMFLSLTLSGFANAQATKGDASVMVWRPDGSYTMTHIGGDAAKTLFDSMTIKAREIGPGKALLKKGPNIACLNGYPNVPPGPRYDVYDCAFLIHPDGTTEGKL